MEIACLPIERSFGGEGRRLSSLWCAHLSPPAGSAVAPLNQPVKVLNIVPYRLPNALGSLQSALVVTCAVT